MTDVAWRRSREECESFVVTATLQIMFELRVHRRGELGGNRYDALRNFHERLQMPFGVAFIPTSILNHGNALLERSNEECFRAVALRERIALEYFALGCGSRLRSRCVPLTRYACGMQVRGNIGKAQGVRFKEAAMAAASARNWCSASCQSLEWSPEIPWFWRFSARK